MFDFLSDDKKGIILSYPFVQDFVNGFINVQLFLENLRYFESDLIQKGFSKEEIDQITQPYKDSGLFTVNRFIEELKKSIVNNKILTSLYEVRNSKILLEKLILDKDFSNPELISLQSKISENQDGKIIEELLEFKYRAEGFIRLLRKIREKERYKKHFHDIDILIGVLELLFAKGLIEKLSRNLNDQSNALKQNNFFLFLIRYQEEKIMFFELNENLNSLKARFIVDEVVHIVHKKKRLARILEELKVVYSKPKIVIYLIYMPLIILLHPIAIAHERLKGEKGNISFDDSPKIKEYLKQLEKRQPEYSPETVNLARQLKEEYGIDVIGDFQYVHLSVLRSILSKFDVSEIRTSLKKVIFIAGVHSDFDVDNSGIYIGSKSTIRVLTKEIGWEITLEHEIAHSRHEALPSEIKRLWLDVNNSGVNYDASQKFTYSMGVFQCLDTQVPTQSQI